MALKLRCDIKNYWKNKSVCAVGRFVPWKHYDIDYDTSMALSLSHVKGAYPIKVSYRDHVSYNTDFWAQFREQYNVDVASQNYKKFLS